MFKKTKTTQQKLLYTTQTLQPSFKGGKFVKLFQISSLAPKYPKEEVSYTTYSSINIQTFQVLQSQTVLYLSLWRLWATERDKDAFQFISILSLWEGIMKQMQPPCVAAVCVLCIYYIVGCVHPIQQN